MNDYRIIYTTEAGESFTSSLITERTEAAARKYFTTMNKGLGFTVSGIELVRENTCATKQHERDTLEAIKKMVAELGPQSYLATAFEGCFQDAEDNIYDDAAYSMKGRWESAEQRVKELEGKLKAAQAGINELIQNNGWCSTWATKSWPPTLSGELSPERRRTQSGCWPKKTGSPLKRSGWPVNGGSQNEDIIPPPHSLYVPTEHCTSWRQPGSL